MNHKSKKYSLKPFIILVILLVLPGFLYYILTLKGENRYKPLPIFGEKKLSGTFHKRRGKVIADTVYHQVNLSGFKNQEGLVLEDTTYQKQVKVVNFYFNDCKDGCARVLHAMSRSDSNYSQNPMVKFLSINVNPNGNTFEEFKHFASRYDSSSKKWDFLMSDMAKTDTLLKVGFGLDAGFYEGKPFAPNKIVLLDFQNRIRGYYDGTFKPDLDKLNDEIKVLIVEQLRNIKEFKD